MTADTKEWCSPRRAPLQHLATTRNLCYL